MGKEKAGFMTAKAIGNRIKSKGLQKLRWYCQMCQKQCRDENGFKCHCMTEAHQRQLMVAGENPESFNNFFSDEFLKDFMQLLKTRFGTKRVQNNVVYNEYIGFKEHIHMNSTKWETLSEFTKWLGREGYCKVDQTEKGWFVQYIDRDPRVLARQKELEKQKEREQDDEERQARIIEEMVKKGKEKEMASGEAPVEFTNLQRKEGDEKVTFKFGGSSEAKSEEPSSSKMSFSSKSRSESSKRKLDSSQLFHKPSKKEKSAMDEIISAEKAKKKKLDKNQENWLCIGIVVKVKTTRLGDKYHKKKGTVVELKDRFTAIVCMANTGDKVKLDQMHLETVLPKFGKEVIIVNGEYRGDRAIMTSVNMKKFTADVEICEGKYTGRVVKGIKYENISKKAD